MPLANPLFWQGLSFTTGAVLIVSVSIWWLYRSPLRRGARPVDAGQPSRRLAGWLAALLGLAAVQLVGGALWDASMHIRTGEVPAGADFLWPPHIMIYSAFLLSLLVALIAVAVVAVPAWRAGSRDPREWVRCNPYLGAVALASAYSLLSIPGDALWHALYGLDLTAWSPPHVLIGAMMCTVMISAVAVLARARPDTPGWNRFDLAIPVLLALMLNVAIIIGTIEWEVWGGDAALLVRRNPIWVYPLVGGALAFATLVLARRLSRFSGAATLTALVFFAVRLGIALVMRFTDNVVPSLPPVFILGAIALDVVPWERIRAPRARDAAMAAAFTAAYVLVALPLLALRAHLPRFTGSDIALTVITTLGLSLIALPFIRAASQRIAHT
jgi:hypothetical protein